MMKKEEKKKPYGRVMLQIALLIGMTFSLSYFIYEADKGLDNSSYEIKYEKKSYASNILPFMLRLIGKLIFNGKSFASALEQSDLQTGVYTCLKDKQNNICQEYATSECGQKCNSACIPSSSAEISECKTGTCYNTFEGTCQLGSPKQPCEENGGQWHDDPYGNVPVCEKGCCVLGGNARLTTERQCIKNAETLGARKDFRPEISTEIACLALSTEQEKGACILGQDENGKNACRFTTKVDCLQSIKGKFYSNYLCSAPELNTMCQKQKTAKCIEGEDEIHWFDSCGNRENIYDANKVKSYNNGKILAKSESCSLSSGTNAFANQQSCGNCNRLLGSVCGKSTANEKLADSTIDFVCRDINCIDENGKARKNGESWCAYQGAIGVDKNRGSDSIGSRHYRKTCRDGEVRADACADFRNEICVETQTPIQNGEKFSAAACRTNLAYLCYDYNKEGKKEQCEKNPDCFIKKVYVNEQFTFDFCLPKYKPGFDLNERGDGAEAICKIGTQSCKYIKIKTLGGKKEINKECITEKFTEQMNDFCMSLGDCGAQVNYQGTLGESYGIIDGKELSSSYISDIKKYADEKLFKGQYAEPGEEFFSELGIPGLLGQANYKEIKTGKDANMLSGVIGAAGILLKLGAGSLPGAAAHGSTAAASGLSSVVAAVGGAAAGAALGLAMTSFLLDSTGVGRGLPTAATYHLLASGAAGGALVGLAAAGKAGAAGSTIAAAAPILAVVGLIIVVVVIIVIIIFWALGIGKKKEITVTFTCKPWQAAAGGAKCSECGKDGFPCAKYACQSLGQGCEYINEESGIPECVWISKDDAAPPLITPMTELLPSEYKYEKLDSGIKIKSSESDGCIKETYNAIPFGLALNEPGQCKMAFNHTSSFNEMGFDLAGRSMYLRNHTLPIIVPSLESLGIEGFDPFVKSEYNIYVRCQDKNGNKNENEYLINFCIKQGPDTTPPAIVDREPYLENIAFNATSINASVFTNEPAECKWDFSDKEYSAMTNNFVCSNDLEDRKLLGWQCSTLFPITQNNNTFYARCLDQPWFQGINESLRNANTQGYNFTLKKSSTELKIDSINIDNKTFTFATEPASLEIEVKTSGGLDGTAKCFYSWKGGREIEFRYGAWTSVHRQVFQALYSGIVELPVRCEDVVGNSASKTAEFEIKIDDKAPEVTRAYNKDGSLVIITNEDSQCYYSLNKEEQCLFAFENATEMSGSGKEHSTGFDENALYYIKCKDEFNNYKGECSIVVKGGRV